MKHNEQATGPGRWMSDVPGPGSSIPFMEDPMIRAQKWAGNTWTHTVTLQDKMMRGMSSLPRDCHPPKKDSIINLDKPQPMSFPSSRKLTTEQTRAIAPAWTLRGISNNNWMEPMAPPILLNPFASSENSREMSKKEYVNKCNNFSIK
tara:strand:- start:124 stop:567 length:444 start_codon:yes stop_codon:yes gene_type:complete